MNQLFYRVKNLAKSKFPDSTSKNHLDKLIEEISEVIESDDNTKIFEYADCLIALLSAVITDGYSLNELLAAGYLKMNINEKRNWEKKSDGTYHHNKQ